MMNEVWMEYHSQLYGLGQQLSSVPSGCLVPRARREKYLLSVAAVYNELIDANVRNVLHQLICVQK